MDLVIRNGSVLTDGAFAAVDVGVENGVICEIAPSISSGGREEIDAGGRLVVPGLTEAHVHLGPDLPPSPQPVRPLQMPGMPFSGPTPEQALERVHEAAQLPGDWITAFIGPAVARDRRNWRQALDQAAGERPTMLRGFWGHTLLLNSAALQRLGVPEDAPDPLGGWWGRDARGRLDGGAWEAAQWSGWGLAPTVTPQRLADVLGEAAKRYARWGVTSVHLMNNGKTVQDTAAAVALLDHRQRWTVYAWGSNASTVAGGWDEVEQAHDLPRLMRAEGPKWILDGTPIEQNAVKREDYPGRPGWRGRHNFSAAQEREILQTRSTLDSSAMASPARSSTRRCCARHPASPSPPSPAAIRTRCMPTSVP